MDHKLNERTDYGKHVLLEKDAPTDPLQLLGLWLAEANEALHLDHNAMVLATQGEHGPSARVVLLRGLLPEGLEFFTNYNSSKGKDMAHNDRCSVLFFWPELERQVRVEGKVSKVSAGRSDDYFASRPRESQLGAWASAQSEPVADRDALEKQFREVEARFEGAPVPRPPHWGGYLLCPRRIEFWQGRPNRLHDRLLYELNEGWEVRRLQP